MSIDMISDGAAESVFARGGVKFSRTCVIACCGCVGLRVGSGLVLRSNVFLGVLLLWD
jgi:hypothetical protein